MLESAHRVWKCVKAALHSKSTHLSHDIPMPGFRYFFCVWNFISFCAQFVLSIGFPDVFSFFLGGDSHDKILQNIPQFTLWVKAKQLDTVRMTISKIHRVCYRVPSTHRWKEPCKNWNEFWMHNSVLIVSSLLGSSKISKYPNPLNPFPLSWRLCQDMMELVCGISLLCKGSEDCWEFENVEGVRVITPFITSRSPPFILEHQKIFGKDCELRGCPSTDRSIILDFLQLLKRIYRSVRYDVFTLKKPSFPRRGWCFSATVLMITTLKMAC